jgi:hypothetical protein
VKWKHTAAPRLGDERTEIRFAWLPTKLDDGYTVWLETYRVHLRYESCVWPKPWRVYKTETLWMHL